MDFVTILPTHFVPYRMFTPIGRSTVLDIESIWDVHQYRMFTHIGRSPIRMIMMIMIMMIAMTMMMIMMTIMI